MRALFLLLSALVGCSDGDVRGDAGPLLPSSEGADPQFAADPGSGEMRGPLPFGASCVRTSDCARGTCLKSATATRGFCASFCWASPFASTSITIEPCAKSEVCVRGGEVGICLKPCTTRADCTFGLVCDKLNVGTEKFCVPPGE